MKRFFGNLIIAIALASVSPVIAMGQEYTNTPVTVSKDKVKVNGEVCYSHVVLEKQTLFSISKAYNVSVDEIYRLNPSLKETGLKKNSIILIPSEREERQRQLDSLTSVTVQKQTKETVAQTVHIRKWFEDLNSIAEKYGVTPEEIMLANNLKTTRLSNRQRLIIPSHDSNSEKSEGIDENETVAGVVEIKDSTRTEIYEEVWPSSFIPNEKVKATLLLPLKTADGRSFYRNTRCTVRTQLQDHT